MSASHLPAPIAALTVAYLRLHAQVSSGELEPSRALTELLTNIVVDPKGVRWRINSEGLCETSTDGSNWHVSDVGDWADSGSVAPPPAQQSSAPPPAPAPPAGPDVSAEQPVVEVAASKAPPGGPAPHAEPLPSASAAPVAEPLGPDTSPAPEVSAGDRHSDPVTTGAVDAPVRRTRKPASPATPAQPDTPAAGPPAFGGETNPAPTAPAKPRRNRKPRRDNPPLERTETVAEPAPVTTDTPTVGAPVPAFSVPEAEPAAGPEPVATPLVVDDPGNVGTGFAPNFAAGPAPPDTLGGLFDEDVAQVDPAIAATPDSVHTGGPARRSQSAFADTDSLGAGSTDIPMTTGIPLSVLEPPSRPAPTAAPAWAHQLPSAANPVQEDLDTDVPKRSRLRAPGWMKPTTAKAATVWRRAPALVAVLVVIFALVGASLFMAGSETAPPATTSGPDATQVTTTLTSLASGNLATVASVVVTSDEAQNAVTAATFAGLAPAGLAVTAQPGFTSDGAASMQTWWLVSASAPERMLARTQVSWLQVGPTWKLATVPSFTGVPAS